MDQIIGIFVLLIILSLLERVLKGQKGRTRRPPPADGDWEATDEERNVLGEQGVSLRELLAEELGLNLERRPTVRRLPETVAGPGPDAELPDSFSDRAAGESPMRGGEPPAPPGIERVVYYPTPRGAPQPPEKTAGPGAAAAIRAAEARKRATRMRRRGSALRLQRPEDDRLPVRRGEAASLERPRQMGDHQLFHERYAVPQPVSSHEEFHTRYVDAESRPAARRASVVLPDDPRWSAVQRAIVWSEILGPPRGLD